MPTLEEAILLATKAHSGQRDKAGVAYILHPLRVMLRMETEEERMTAILHDVLEDGPYKPADLERAGYSDRVLAALDCLMRRGDEPYDRFIARVKPNPLARRVKLADLEDNLDLRRLGEVQAKDLERLRKYWQAWSDLRRD